MPHCGLNPADTCSGTAVLLRGYCSSLTRQPNLTTELFHKNAVQTLLLTPSIDYHRTCTVCYYH